MARLTMACLALGLSAHAWAADDPRAEQVYKQAMEADENGDCPTALRLMQKYQMMAHDALASHPDWARDVRMAIASCKKQLADSQSEHHHQEVHGDPHPKQSRGADH